MSTDNFVDQLRVEDVPKRTRKRKVVLPGQRKISLRHRLRTSWQLYLLVLPAVIWVLIFMYWPMYGIQIAFRDFTPVGGLTGSEWVGMKHISRFVESYNFWPLLRNTLVLAFYELIAGFPIPIVLALALNAVRQKYFSRVVQLITYAPNFISVVVVVGILVMLLDPSTGILPHALNLLEITPPAFLTDPGWFRHTYVWSGIWQTAGFSAIIYLAALTAVPPELHEAAKVDGASQLRRMWHIEVPAILPIAIVLMILSVGTIMSVGFEKVLLMQNPLNLTTSQVIDTYVYEVGLKSPIPQYSYATAIGLFRSVVGLILLVAVNSLAKRVAKAGLF
ncbi:ABC transporter permease [Brachybacterium sacelli]|uniref:ABC-type polysaccharide transport system permease subunit n=1 Tax=Brachybacterium sacelli TaxID=173364 RepID=A0ABS4X1U4_9MICO|nr:ABC transporter permease subunit [Brachybacterium sacelli]MBP2382429.1 ABC-type polysaccharide transport system permease subunit [Brachybacterium sacelli]